MLNLRCLISWLFSFFCQRSGESGCLNREPEELCVLFLFQAKLLSSQVWCLLYFFDGCLRSQKDPHQIRRKCFFDRAFGVGRKRSDKNMTFENDFFFNFKSYFVFKSYFRCRSLRNKPSDHRIMQYKVYDISLSCHSVKRRENPEVAIFIGSLYERSSILSVRTLICSFLF